MSAAKIAARRRDWLSDMAVSDPTSRPLPRSRGKNGTTSYVKLRLGLTGLASASAIRGHVIEQALCCLVPKKLTSPIYSVRSTIKLGPVIFSYPGFGRSISEGTRMSNETIRQALEKTSRLFQSE